MTALTPSREVISTIPKLERRATLCLNTVQGLVAPVWLTAMHRNKKNRKCNKATQAIIHAEFSAAPGIFT